MKYIFVVSFAFLCTMGDVYAKTDPLVEARQAQIEARQVGEVQIEKAKLEKRLANAKQAKECTDKVRKFENEMMYLKGRLEGIEWMLKNRDKIE